MAITTFRSFKVTDFGTNRKPIYDFLLVINSNLPPILRRFQVSLSIEGCLTLTPPLGVIPCEYPDKLYLSRNYRDCPTRYYNRTIVSSFVWTQYRNMMDRRTDRQTKSLQLVQRSALRATRTRCKNQPRFTEQKIKKNPDKEKSSNLKIPPKLTPKCCIILHKYKHSDVKHSNDRQRRRIERCYIFAARIACDSGPTCFSQLRTEKFVILYRLGNI